MVKCFYCGESLNYLPFKCKYCGEKFCKAHRLPENHNCSFSSVNSAENIGQVRNKSVDYTMYGDVHTKENEIANSRVKSRRKKKSFGNNFLSSNKISRVSMDKITASNNIFINFISKIRSMHGYSLVMLLQIILYIISLVFDALGLTGYLYLSVIAFIPPNFLYYTLFTSLLLPSYPSFSSIISLLFNFLILWFLGRTIELQFGKKLFLQIYFFGALLTSVFILFGGMILMFLPNFGLVLITPFYSSYGGLLALLAFAAFLDPERKVVLYLYFIPVQLKRKYLYYIFIGFQLISGFFSLSLGYDMTFLMNFANIIGSFVGLYLLKSHIGGASRGFYMNRF